MILVDDNYATIVAAVHQGRVIFDNIKKFLRYLLSSNMGEVVTVVFGVVFAGFLGLTAATGSGELVVPLLATQILWINLVTDSAPALAMGVDPEIDDVMARMPRRPEDRIMDRAMWARIMFIGLVMGAVTLLTIDMFLPGGVIPGSDSLEVARTAGFTTLVFAQLFNALNSRSETTSAFRGLFTNKWLWGALVLGIRPAGARRPGPVPPGGLRHCPARPRPVGGSGGDGLGRAVGRGACQVDPSPGARRVTPGRRVAAGAPNP